MPRYFFNRTDGHRDIDNNGFELKDIHAARLEAIRYLAQSLLDHPEAIWDGSDLNVQILDERRLLLSTVTTIVTDAPALSSGK